jgi:hypothetical protein
MLTLSIDNLCETLTATSDSGLINFMQGNGKSMSNICNYALDLSYNCCPMITYNIAPVYNFTVTYLHSTLFPYTGTTIIVSGINRTVVTEDSQIVLERFVTDDLVYVVEPVNYLNLPGIQVSALDTYDTTPTLWRLTITNDCGHVFVFTFTTGTASSGSVTGLGIVRPSVPTGITYTSTTSMTLSASLFGQTNSFLDGIYTATITEYDEDGASIVEDHTLFVDCDTTCQVQTLAHKCEDPIHLFRWQALTYNNTCRVLTMQQACDLYRLLYSAISKLCTKPANCNNCKSCK